VTSLVVNGTPVTVKQRHPHLLAALREELDVLSPKDGCSPSGQCGCCTVMVNGKAVVSCQQSLERLEGANVVTLEGWSDADRELYSACFAAAGGLQCGFCIPGIIVRAKAQIDKKGPSITRQDLTRHLGAHLCRCTGYVKVLDALVNAAKGEAPTLAEVGGIGSRAPKYEARDLALGSRGYVDDIRVPGMLHAALHLTRHTRATITAIAVDAARAVPGVHAVFTAADVPGELKVGLIYKDWPILIPVGGRTSFAGDVIAIVVADDLQTQRIEHAFLEPESTVAVPSGSGDSRALHVYSGGQGVWDDRNDIARILSLDNTRVTVELVSNGGAFGGKEDMSNQGQTALAAWLLDRPVKCTLSREESLLIHAKRHPIRMHYTLGATNDGVLTALRVRAVGDSGAYASVGMKVLERMAGHASGPYHLPTIDAEAIAVRTNNPVCGAFRGFGANQAQFAMEGMLDRMAERLGMSSFDIRKRNVIRPGMVWGPGQIMDDGCLGAEACLDAVKPQYDRAMAEGKCVGVAVGLKNSGLGNGFKEVTKAVVRFRSDGIVEVRHGWTEMGQGIHTVAMQVAVEELGIAAERIRVIVDTTRELGFGQTTGSRGTLMGAGAVQDACRVAREGGCRTDVDYVGEYRVDWTTKLGDPNVTNPIIHSTFGYAAQLVIVNPDTGAIEEVVAAHDVGRAVNPTLCEGQIEGSVHMGLGYALSEDFPSDPATGFPTNMTLKSLGILRPKDVPAITTILVESAQPNSPYGIKGVGEIGLVPTAGAVAAALHAFDGTWRSRLPMRPRNTDGDE